MVHADITVADSSHGILNGGEVDQVLEIDYSLNSRSPGTKGPKSLSDFDSMSRSCLYLLRGSPIEKAVSFRDSLSACAGYDGTRGVWRLPSGVRV
jgi:hypothetical protein